MPVSHLAGSGLLPWGLPSPHVLDEHLDLILTCLGRIFLYQLTLQAYSSREREAGLQALRQIDAPIPSSFRVGSPFHIRLAVDGITRLVSSLHRSCSVLYSDGAR